MDQACPLDQHCATKRAFRLLPKAGVLAILRGNRGPFFPSASRGLMPNQRIQNLTAALPYSLREAVNGYVDAVSAALPEIERDSGVDIGADRSDEFLLIVAIRRIWSSVNNQYWIMNDCIGMASRTDVVLPTADAIQMRGFRVGRDEISAGSTAFEESREFLQDFDQLIDDLEIEELVSETNSLSDLAKRMFPRTQ